MNRRLQEEIVDLCLKRQDTKFFLKCGKTVIISGKTFLIVPGAVFGENIKGDYVEIDRDNIIRAFGIQFH